MKMKKILMAGLGTALVATLGLVFIPRQADAVIQTQLDFGDRGTEVTELQAFLAGDASIYPEGLVTGYYGTLTTRAIQRFQCQNNIVCSGTAATTGYGRVGPVTMTALNAFMGTGGPSTDVDAPIMSDEAVVTASNSATITWSTNENSTSRVMYGTVWPFLYATAPSAVDATFNTSSNVTIGGLQSNSQYFFVRESVDLAGNIMWTGAESFTTN